MPLEPHSLALADLARMAPSRTTEGWVSMLGYDVTSWRKAVVILGATAVAAAAGVAGAESAGAGGQAAMWGHVTSRVSVSTSGAQADDTGFTSQGVSADGRFIAFSSRASNLVPGDTNESPDVFVRDTVKDVTRRVSVGSAGQQGSCDIDPNVDDCIGSIFPAISADGRFVTFRSAAPNLVPGDTNDEIDVFVRDRLAGVTRRVSVGSNGRQGNFSSSQSAISADGRFVAFRSGATNLVRGDTNGTPDVFVRDRAKGVTRRVSVGPSGRQSDGSSSSPVISANGRIVSFSSDASNLVAGDTNAADDVFVRAGGLTTRVSVGSGGVQANGSSGTQDLQSTAISADGRFVAFTSEASNLAPGDTNADLDVFLRDRAERETRRVSVGSNGQQANGSSVQPSISAHGRYVAFASIASNLVPGDTNETVDIFVRVAGTGTKRASVSSIGQQANDDSFQPAI